MSQYYEQNHADIGPYAKASVFGNEHALLSNFGDRDQGKFIPHESVALFRRVLHDDSRIARLPLDVVLDVLLVLFRPLPIRSDTSRLHPPETEVKCRQGFHKLLFYGISGASPLDSSEVFEGACDWVGSGVPYIFLGVELIRRKHRDFTWCRIILQELANSGRLIFRQNWWHIYIFDWTGQLFLWSVFHSIPFQFDVKVCMRSICNEAHVSM